MTDVVRLYLHSPAKAMTLEIVDAFDKEGVKHVRALCLQSGSVYEMPLNMAGWKQAGWVPEKVIEPNEFDEPDRRFQAGF